jgi:transcriptional regulator with XRE-family HTH domain
MGNLSENLKILRQERNLSQEELAKILRVKQNTISNIERYNRKPSY